MMSLQRIDIILFLLSCLFFESSIGQRNPANICETRMSQVMIGYSDMTCNCGQVPPQSIGQINSLTIDLSACSFNESARAINWMQLDNIYRPRRVNLINVEIYFTQIPTNSWNSTIRRIDLINCFLPNITAHAFGGLKYLEEIHLSTNYIDRVMANAFSDLPFLKTLEFSDSYIGDMEENAINNLPNIKDLAFVRCHIEIMRRHAINNNRVPDLPVTGDCPAIDIRTNHQNLNTMRTITARILESTENLPLPKFGARLLFLHCTISNLLTNSVTSNLFAFGIFGGNKISYFGERALNLELSNQCEITALMFSTNTFRSVQTGAFASVASYSASSHENYLVLINNTFEYVAPEGFLIHPSLKIYTVEQNSFICQCELFQWVLTADVSSNQKELERNLLSRGKCNDTQQMLSEFTAHCPTDLPATEKPKVVTEMMFKPWTGDHHHTTTSHPVVSYTEPNTSGSSRVTMGLSTVFVIMWMCISENLSS